MAYPGGNSKVMPSMQQVRPTSNMASTPYSGFDATFLRSSTRTPVDINDLVLGRIEDTLKQITNVVLKYIIGLVGILLILIAFVIILLQLYPSLVVLPAFITRSAIWTRVIQPLPPGFWLLLALLGTPLVAQIPNLGKDISLYIILAVGAVTAIYSIMIPNCKRYLLTFAGLYSVLIALLKLGVLGLEAVNTASITSTAINWHVIIVTVLTIIDFYIFGPRCARV